MNPHTLCVDLDGTLIRTDSLVECLLFSLKKQPWLVFLIPFYILRGRLAFKLWIAQKSKSWVADHLPYNHSVLEQIREVKSAGGQVYLATAAHESIAKKVCAHIQLFDGFFATNEHLNLSGKNKAQRLSQEFGEKQFTYAGNSSADWPVWEKAHSAWVVSSSSPFLSRTKNEFQVSHHFEARQQPHLKLWIKALRVHQWSKNLLLFVPLLTAHFFQKAALVNSLMAFVSFGFTASAVYLINDLLDLDQDREHFSKKNRPFASGELPLLSGLLVAPVLFVLGLILAYCVNVYFLCALALYIILTFSYSLFLKSKALVDTFCLAGLYTLRIFAGACAVGVGLSHWLLSFSMFLFLSLAIVKRYSEMSETIKRRPDKQKVRGYLVTDISFLLTLGLGSGLVSLLVFTLYLSSPEVRGLYSRPQILWLAHVVLFYWIARVWLLTTRDQMNEDPILFALKDPLTFILAAIILFVFMLSQPILH